MATDTVLIIPPKQTHHILSKPESDVDAYGPQNETIQARYTIGDKEIYLNNFHFSVIRKELTKNLPVLIENIAEELALGFQQYWGTSKEWHKVKAWDSVLKIVARAANRVFIGTTLCSYNMHLRLAAIYQRTNESIGRNEEFLTHSRKYSMSIFGGAVMINMSPTCIRPILGPLIALIGKRHFVVCQRLCLPIVVERLRNIAHKRIEPEIEWEGPVGHDQSPYT